MGVPSYVPQQYAGYVASTSAKYGVDPDIIAAIIQTESGWNMAVGDNTGDGAGSYGLGQLIAANASSYPQYQPGNAAGQIDTVGQILSQNYKATGSWNSAIEAYNTGLGGVGSAAGADYSGKVWGNIANPPAVGSQGSALTSTAVKSLLGLDPATYQAPPQDTGTSNASQILSDQSGSSLQVGNTASTPSPIDGPSDGILGANTTVDAANNPIESGNNWDNQTNPNPTPVE